MCYTFINVEITKKEMKKKNEKINGIWNKI